MEDVDDEEGGEGDEDDDKRNRDLRLRFLFDRSESTEESWPALTTTCCLTCRDKKRNRPRSGSVLPRGCRVDRSRQDKETPGAALVRVAAAERELYGAGGLMLTVVSKIPGTLLERKGYFCRSRMLLLIKSPMGEPR
jgi:hypothetical protein